MITLESQSNNEKKKKKKKGVKKVLSVGENNYRLRARFQGVLRDEGTIGRLVRQSGILYC